MSAQDMHWSQLTANLMYQNPAFTGINKRFTISTGYRNQWSAINSAYNSALVSGDFRINESESSKIAISSGLLIYRDVAGEGKYSNNSGGLNLSCLARLNPEFRFGIGFACNLVQTAYINNNYTWGSQYDGSAFNTGLSSNEQQTFQSRNYADLNLGLALAYDKSKSTSFTNSKSAFILGYSLNHFNRANISLNGKSNKLEMKHTLFTQGIFGIRDNKALKPVLLRNLQGTMVNITTGTLCRFSFDEESKITGIKKASAFSVGMLYRYLDALIPTFEFEKASWLFGFSYDINVSRLSSASRFRGGPEIWMRFTNSGDYLFKHRR